MTDCFLGWKSRAAECWVANDIFGEELARKILFKPNFELRRLLAVLSLQTLTTKEVYDAFRQAGLKDKKVIADALKQMLNTEWVQSYREGKKVYYRFGDLCRLLVASENTIDFEFIATVCGDCKDRRACTERLARINNEAKEYME